MVEAISARSLARSLAHLGVIIRERFADAFHDVAKGLVFGRVILEKRKERTRPNSGLVEVLLENIFRFAKWGARVRLYFF